MVSLSPLARLFFISLWNVADDEGFIEDEPERLAMLVMPKEDSETIDDLLQMFVASDRLEVYVCEEEHRVFYRIKNWLKHQKVDHPSKSRIFREGSRKLAISQEVRRAVAIKYGCEPGEEIEAKCYYCSTQGLIHWWRNKNGKPSGWVSFVGLELDHLEDEYGGGAGVPENIVLSCRHCNRSKGTRPWIDMLCAANGIQASLFSNPHEVSRGFQVGSGNRDQGKEHGKEQEEDIEKRKRFIPPTQEEVKSYVEAQDLYYVDPQRFIDFYSSKNWFVGKNKMKDWMAAARNWHRRKLDEKGPMSIPHVGEYPEGEVPGQ